MREWLRAFLPKKYDVTSGFIIPDVVQVDGYKLYHYGVIIFDAMNAPILWTDSNPDQADQGKKRAIPARYVHSVIEVKVAFGATPAKNALQKLGEINNLASHLPPWFFCLVVFIELPVALALQGRLPRYLLPVSPIHGFRGGLIMRCEINADISGVIELHRVDDPTSTQNTKDLPLARDVDTLDIFVNANGACSLPPGAGARFVPDGISNWMVQKVYALQFRKGDICIILSWSANGFSQFTLDLLHRLEGADPRLDNRYFFWQVFDRLERRG